ncbi:MAG: hypothetical protein HFG26_07570 [Provencibacterium sp.]|nr:hypothetical protein [Provencibacterium sp.]
MKRSSWKGCVRRALALFVCAAMAAGTFSGCQKRKSSVPQVDVDLIQIAPSSETEGIIPLDSSFTVSFAEKVRMSAGEAQQLFRFIPDTAFTAEKQGGGFVLRPESNLPQNTVVNLQAVDAKGTVLRSWAYQTQTALRVTRSTPGDRMEYVPTDTGIELVFTSSLVSEEAFAQHFTLTAEESGAPVEGRVLRSGETLVFVPAEALQEATIYSATLDGGLAAADGMELGEDYTFSFRTAEVGDGKGRGDYFTNASPIAETFVTGDAPLLAVNCDGEFIGRKVTVSIYRYRSPEDYRSALEALAAERNGSRFPDYVRPKVDTGSLDSLGSFEAEIVSPGGDSYWGTKYVPLPGEFPTGWYYVEARMTSPVSGQELSLEKFLQVSELSLYHMQAEGEALFWVNHAGTGEPVANADLTISGPVPASGRSGADGTLRLTAAAEGEDSVCILDITGGDQRFIDLYTARQAGELSASERYISYLYTDRPIYMSSDTIQVWGVVRPRAGGTEPPEGLRLSLGSYLDEELYSLPVSLGPDGTFTASLSFERLGGREMNYQALRLVYGEGEETEELSTVGVTIGDYVKPVYIPSVSQDRPVYQDGDTAQITFAASFFDNTPAVGFSAELTLYDRGAQTFTVTTGADGSATQAFALNWNDSEEEAASWRPYYWSLYASNAMGENENFHLYQSIPFFRRSLAIRTELEGSRDNRKLTIQTNAIDLSGIQEREELNEEENYLGAPVDQPITVEVHREYHVKTPAGAYYDFIRKRNVTYYDYELRDDVVDTYEVKTSGGRCVLTDLPQKEKEASYYLLLTARDGQGRLVEERVWLGMSDFYYSQGMHRYTFYREDVLGDDYTERTYFTEETELLFSLLDNGTGVESGRLLWAVAQTGIESYAAEAAPSFSLPFREELAPNFMLAGAYFDGRYVYEVTQTVLRFNPKNRELEIAVTADREKYAPGDTAHVELLVTEKKDGSPVPDAAVSLSLVDEAVFAIEDRQANPLQELYRSVYSPDIVSYTSYRQYNFLGEMGAEKGGGGGDEGLRTDFQDTAAFITLTTGADGKASADLPLPDNVTSWRATVQAVSKNLHAGDNREAVITTLPFFINDVLSAQFLEGDDAALTLRCAGNAVTEETQVDYTLSVEGPGMDGEERTASGRALDYTVLSVGKLQKGTYTITMNARSGEYSDGVQRTVQVLSSGVETQLSKTFSLEEGIAVDPQRFPVRVGFYNADYAMWAEVLDHLWSAWGERADERIARRYALEKLCELSGEEPPETSDSLSDIMDTYGHISLFPYDSSSVQLSARAHLAAPEYLIGGRQQTSVFRNVLGYEGSESDETAYAYLGMAAHREPVLGTLREKMQNPSGFSEKDRLVLLAALAAIGDMETAGAYYEELVASKLEEGTNSAGETILFYGKGADVNENLEWTALMSLSASMLRMPQADGMMRYLMSNRSTRELYYLEEMVYLRYNEPKAETAARVSYKKDGKRVTHDLEKTGMKFVSFVAEDFDQAQVKEESGSVYAWVYYTGGLEEALEQGNRSITLSKTIAPKEGTQLKTGDIARITIRPQMDNRLDPYGMTIDDYIPSGLRFLSVENGSENDGKMVGGWQLVRREGQKVSFSYYAYSFTAQEGEPAPGEETYESPSELVYYVRCAVPGTYVVDNAYAGLQLSSAWGASERASVSIDA